MYSVHKTVHQPTGIDDAVYCNFINDKDDNLITFSANRLQVYRICADKKNKSNKTKLEFIESFYLYGNIAAIKPCRYGVMKKDALILAFTDAKVIFDNNYCKTKNFIHFDKTIFKNSFQLLNMIRLVAI